MFKQFVAYSYRKLGWCVLQSAAKAVHSDILAGPFETREEAERILSTLSTKNDFPPL